MRAVCLSSLLIVLATCTNLVTSSPLQTHRGPRSKGALKALVDQSVLKEYLELPQSERLLQAREKQGYLIQQEHEFNHDDPPRRLTSDQDDQIRQYMSDHLEWRYLVGYWATEARPGDEILPDYDMENQPNYPGVIEGTEEYSFPRLRLVRATDVLSVKKAIERFKRRPAWNEEQEEALRALQRVAFCDLVAFSPGNTVASSDLDKFRQAIEEDRPEWFNEKDCEMEHKKKGSLLQRLTGKARSYFMSTWIGKKIMSLIAAIISLTAL